MRPMNHPVDPSPSHSVQTPWEAALSQQDTAAGPGGEEVGGGDRELPGPCPPSPTRVFHRRPCETSQNRNGDMDIPLGLKDDGVPGH